MRAFSITEARGAVRAKLPDRALKVVVGSLAAAAVVAVTLVGAVAVDSAAVAAASVAVADSVAVVRWSSSSQPHAKRR